jgi:anti-sigma B factor antagonist
MVMQFEKRIVGDVAIITVTGEITLNKGGEAQLHDSIRSVIQEGHPKVLVDLAGVSYVDSAGLGQLVQAHSVAKNHGGSLRVFNPTTRLRDLLTLTRLTTVIGTYDDEAQALASYGAAQR